MRRLVTLATLLAGSAAFAPAALALDCAAPVGDVQTAICTDPEVKAADEAMTAAYQSALAKLAPENQPGLTASQDAYLKQREDSCSQEDGRKECLLGSISWRRDYLTAKPESGPGLVTTLLPFASAQPQTDTACSTMVSLHKFGGASPGETGFDAAVQKVIDNAAGEWGKRESTPDYPYDCNYGLTSGVSYASPDLIAVQVYFDAFQGGAHGIYGRIPIVIDLKTGAVPDVKALFDDKARESLAATCTASLKAEKLSRLGEVEDAAARKEMLDGLDAEMKDYAGTIAEHVADFADWIVYEDRAEIYFGPYEVGAYAEGEFTCALPKADLAAAAGAKGWIVP